ncbi:MAG: LysR substrate-binding domain-containing protein, partial [Boseongicola sp.]|nr:LysR substrate-binding domain-containing protein [Boseongicola sp.]
LRHSLNDDLFVRHGNQLVPTDFAASVKDSLQEELNRLEGLLNPPADFDPSHAIGNFKISASDFFAELLMPALGDHLSQNAPAVTAQLVDLVPYDYVESLERYQADLALIPETSLPDWINHEPLFRSSFSVIGRAANPALEKLESGRELPLDVFCDLSHVLFSPEGKMAAMGDSALEKVGRTRKVAMTLPVFSGVCRTVSESDLIALVPTQLAQKVAAGFGLKYYTPPFEISPALIIAIWHRRSDENPMSKWMRQQVFDLLKPLDRW